MLAICLRHVVLVFSNFNATESRAHLSYVEVHFHLATFMC